ncbi:MAG TPA: FAD-dependent oxidoreductase [Candidatus Thermoplasmatota archaeon]|nr:FAD-dependent oxidoreductase [Candidatus Thermoplasmatota archaeon]
MKKKDTNKQNVCIIGGGLSGLAAGFLLGKKGYRVTIFEREKILGGRALSLLPQSIGYSDYLSLLSRFKITVPFSEPNLETIFETNIMDGFQLDLGFHLIGGGGKYIAGGEYASLGRTIRFLGSPAGIVTEEGYRFPFFSMSDKITLLPRLFQLLFYFRGSRLRALDTVPMDISLQRFKQDKLKQAFELFSRGMSTVNDLSQISTGETLRSLSKLLQGANSLSYPLGGLKCISNAFADSILAHHGIIVHGSTVEEIVVENNQVKGVVVDGVFRNFTRVLSSVPVQDLFSIINETHFSSEYARHLKQLIPSGGLCAYYCLRKISNPALLGKSFMFLQKNLGVQGESAFGMIDFKTAFPATGLSPKGRYLVQAYIICTPDEAKKMAVMIRLREALDSWMRKVIVDFDTQLVWVIYPATQRLEGVAKSMVNEKPSIETPINNFYLIGDCMKSPDIGVNSAVNSANHVASLL